MTRVTGIDGCKSGWLAVTLDISSESIEHAVHLNGTALFEALGDSRVIAIDIPIGLTERGPRECDRAARALLGRPRGSSVFPAPVRAALSAGSRSEADRITRDTDGRGVGAQAWNIYERMLEIDNQLRKSKPLQEQVYESHPEVCFAALNGGQPLAHSKHRPEGLEERWRLIADCFGTDAFNSVRSTYSKRQAADDDILDAFAVCWTAQRILRGKAESLPPHPATDTLGLPMRIVY